MFSLIACSDKQQAKPKDLLNKGSMTVVMADVLIADAVANDKKSHDSSINVNALGAAYYQQIFTLHHISRQQFATSYSYYVNHPAELKEVLDSAQVIISKKMESANKHDSSSVNKPPVTKKPFFKPSLKNEK
jgi:hypothetical protein